MVETRKVQVTGGSTFTVSIPKEWATANDVSAGSTVEFYPEGDSLFLAPAKGRKTGRRARSTLPTSRATS